MGEDIRDGVTAALEGVMGREPREWFVRESIVTSFLAALAAHDLVIIPKKELADFKAHREYGCACKNSSANILVGRVQDG